MKVSINALLTQLKTRWQQLQPRERQLVFWSGLFILATVLWSLDDWQRSELRRLQRALPAAESRLAAMQQMADEFAALNRLRTKDGQGGKAPASANLLIASIKAKGPTLEAFATGSAQIVLKGSVGFDDWIDWLEGAAAQGWRVERANVQRGSGSPGGAVGSVSVIPGALAGTGLVNVEATLVAVLD